MAVRLFLRAERYLRPVEGWLVFWLGVGIVLLSIGAINASAWDVEMPSLLVTGLLAFAFGIILSQQTLPTIRLIAWIVIYGVVLMWVRFTQLATILAREGLFTTAYRTEAAIFSERVASWWQSVISGGSSDDTIGFALFLTAIIWVGMAYFAYALFAEHEIVPPLLIFTIGLAFNSYFGGAELRWLLFVAVLGGVLIGVLHFKSAEVRWQREGVDYSAEIENDVLIVITFLIAGAVALGLLLSTFSVIHFRDTFAELPAVKRVELALDQLFGGVNAQGRPAYRDGVGGVGIMPRTYLIGNAPELYETIVMTATVSRPTTATHWRGLSFDVYTGSGWARSEERRETMASEQRLSLPDVAAFTTLTQTIDWQIDERLTRYSLGLPVQFDHEVTTHWRGTDDLVYVQGRTRTYTIVSQISTATPDQLRQSDSVNPEPVEEAEIPPALLARYTTLPNSIPDQVIELAQSLHDPTLTTYDQAKRIEQFLRQYPYSLDVPPPPTDVDPVAFFLFELQAGYCDYYASAMVVLARLMGLPARVGIGYLAQANERVQTIYQIDGHSWAEIYFPEYGWIEFEPTAGFVERGTTVVDTAEPLTEVAPLPAPERVSQSTKMSWWWMALATVLALASLGWWRLKRQVDDGLLARYDLLYRRGQQAGVATSSAQTPLEFQAEFDQRLKHLQGHRWVQRWGWLQKWVVAVREEGVRLSAEFNTHQYTSDKQDTPPSKQWQTHRKILWWLRWLR